MAATGRPRCHKSNDRFNSELWELCDYKLCFISRFPTLCPHFIRLTFDALSGLTPQQILQHASITNMLQLLHPRAAANLAVLPTPLALNQANALQSQLRPLPAFTTPSLAAVAAAATGTGSTSAMGAQLGSTVSWNCWPDMRDGSNYFFTV